MIRTATHSGRSRQALALAAIAGLTTLLLVGVSQTASASQGAQKPKIILVHGAWADASGWNDVIRGLQKEDYEVIAPANPLRSLSNDAAYIASVLAQTPGPVVLVGHSYGGAVITNAAVGNPNVKALVYIDAFIPEVGEDVLHIAGADSQIPATIEFKKYPPFGDNDVDVYLKHSLFRSTFAGDLPRKLTDVLWAGQRPAALAAGAEPTTKTAWKTIPSWALVGLEDRTITPEAQLSMARRAGAKITRIHSSHLSLISHPDAVVDLIETAAAATSK
jgi:pimeloyl-ACP methyl ester carboxylesterase